MMRLMLLIVLISANCMKLNCDEEPNTSETTIEQTELLPTESELLQSKTGNKETEIEENKASEVAEEIRVSRSSFNESTKHEAPFDETLKIESTNASFTEKSVFNEDVVVTGRQAEKEEEEPKSGIYSVEALQDKAKSVENVENKAEELSETSRSAPETEDRITEELSEASAESKISDNESASSNVNENDRSSDTTEIKDKSDVLDLNKSFGTRRMLSGPENIFIDTMKGSGTTPKAVDVEVETAFKPNLKTYNNFDEFGADRDIKLIDASPTERSPPTVTAKSPNITNSAPQEIFNQQYLPKFYPKSELNIHFPNINSDFQGPRDLPIYFKVKQDEYQLNNQFMEPQNSQFKPAEEYMYFHPRNQQRPRQSQRVFDTPGTLTNKKVESLRADTRNQASQFYQNQVSGTKSFIENKQLMNQNPNSLNEVQLYHNKERMSSDYQRFRDLNNESRNKVQGINNSKIPKPYNQLGNEYPLFRKSQETTDMKINLENNQIGNERFASPYPYMQAPPPQQVKISNSPARYDDIIPTNIKILFQKLASASDYARKLPSNLYRNSINRNYPYSDNSNYKNDVYFHGNRYMPGFQQ